MRIPKYLSPTSLSSWRTNQEEFYLHYLADTPPPRFAQTQPMSVGSAFDARVKSYLYSHFVGDGNAAMSFEALFEAQVEPHNRDFAAGAGEICFQAYQSTGALADIMLLMAGSDTYRFEFTAQESIIEHGGRSVPLLGKPDAYFTVKNTDVVLDWKVNGYCGMSTTSPKKGYVRLRPGGKSHKDCFFGNRDGIEYNVSQTIDMIALDWATQLSTYSWLCGESIGSDFIVAIDQLCGPADSIRVAEFRGLISPKFQWQVFDEYCDLWEIINSDHIFRVDKNGNEISKDQSQARCETLDEQGTLFQDLKNVEYGDWFAKVTRG